MSFLQINLETLSRRNPPLADRIRKLVATPLPPLAIDSWGRPNLIVNSPQGDLWLYPPDLDKTLVQMREQILAVFNPQVMFWMGLGLGHHLKSYLEKPHPLGEFQVILEPSLEIFAHFLSLGDQRKLLADPKFFWLVGIPAEEILTKLQPLAAEPGFAAASVNRLVVNWMPPQPYYDQAAAAIDEFARATLLGHVNPPIDCYYGFKNFMDNLSIIPGTPYLASLKDIFKGKPGIVASTGPSLSLSLDLLKTYQDRAVIFAADSALRLLAKAGIVPPFAGCLERMVATKKHFEGIDTSQTVLVTTPFLHPETLRVYQGPRTFFVHSEHFLRWLDPQARIDSAPMTSVSHLALYALWYMGCRPIFLVGQDLAFDPHTKQSHAKGYLWGKDQAEAEELGIEQRVTVKGNQGQDIDTSEGWLNFAKIFTRLINECKIECYNAIPKDYGITIEGAPWVEPKSAFEEFLKEKISFSAMGERFKKSPSITSEQVRLSVEKTRQELQGVLKICHQVIDDIMAFALTNPPDIQNPQTLQKYHQFFEKIQGLAETHSQSPILNEFVYRVTTGMHNHLLRKGYTLMAEPDADADMLIAKLSIPLSWYDETLIKAKLMLRRLETFTL